MDEEEYEARAATAERPVGPYLPLILEACQEEEFAYEYRHGVTSYGAFTYSLVHTLRTGRAKSFRTLVRAVRTQFRRLGYDQKPQVLGPREIVDGPIPWQG